MKKNKWYRSGLTKGEHVEIPHTILVEGLKSLERLDHAEYVTETDAGMIIDCYFKPAIGTSEADKFHYKIMINWPNIYTGQVKIYRKNGSLVRIIPTNMEDKENKNEIFA